MDINIVFILLGIMIFAVIVSLKLRSNFSALFDMFAGLVGIYGSTALAKSGSITQLSNGNNVVIISSGDGFNTIVILLVLFTVSMFLLSMEKLIHHRV